MKKTMLNVPALYDGFTVVNPATKKAQQLKAGAEWMGGYELTDLYKSPSIAKQQAYNDCFALFRKDKHSAYFAVGHANCMQFSVCWYTVIDDHKCLVYITKCNNYIVPLYREF